MKNMLFLISLILTFNLSAQDAEMLNLINTYRKNNGKSTLIYSNDLSKISKKQVFKIILEQNTVSHSETTSEIATLGVSMPIVKKDMDSFVLFLKEELNVVYKEPKTECEVNTLFKQYILYKFNCSKVHKSILLGQYKHIGLHVELSKIKYIPNYLLINGNKVMLNNTISHYKGNYCAVLNFKR